MSCNNCAIGAQTHGSAANSPEMLWRSVSAATTSSCNGKDLL
jgi:hypothetical protein